MVYSSVATEAEDNEHREKESFKRDNPNDNSPSAEELVKTLVLIVILESCFGQYLDLPEDNNARFWMKMVYDLLKRRFMYENKDKIDEAWAFEAIPYLRQQVNYQEEVSFPRILRWLLAEIDKNAKILDLFNPSKEAVDVTVEATAEKYNITVDNPSTASKEEEKVEPMIEVYQDKMANPFDVQYVEGIAQQTIGILDCGPFVAAYTEYLSDGLQVPNDGLDARLLRKRYDALL
ncbi:hypothetical protein T459_23718 [Capsicum annuum]|uniref:Ubiquitin-like protease family profile domain-containing protein n=1 Tax=Capsicum annuum TaxID=4072 RepID=A0A2G2YT80_CAPAN|nr:hypothetical protein T459_23718 [Capsicum annuum]